MLVLTARGSGHEKVQGIDGGADDYMSKPFRVEEVLARIRVLIRRASENVQSEMRSGEREFWAKHDSTGFIDWDASEPRKFTQRKPTPRTISLRLPVSMIEDLKILANKRDVRYQSLLKVFLAERLEQERRRVI